MVKKTAKPLVSIVIPIKNSALFLENCLGSIRTQNYPNIEVLVVDSKSDDECIDIAKRHKCNIFQYKSNLEEGKFDAPYKRNYGVRKARGKYVYYVDADMELPKGLIGEAVGLFENKHLDALVIPEDSFGVGVWAKAKQLERRCYWHDNNIEAARFFNKTVWNKLGGLDETLGGGGDDWDLHKRLLDSNFKVGRTKKIVLHNEGNLSLVKLAKKRFMYGRDSIRYLVKKPKDGFLSYFPIRWAYIKNIKLFIRNPIIAVFFVVMRSIEYVAGFVGIMFFLIENHEKK